MVVHRVLPRGLCGTLLEIRSQKIVVCHWMGSTDTNTAAESCSTLVRLGLRAMILLRHFVVVQVVVNHVLNLLVLRQWLLLIDLVLREVLTNRGQGSWLHNFFSQAKLKMVFGLVILLALISEAILELIDGTIVTGSLA
jgi:hypothetical protein